MSFKCIACVETQEIEVLSPWNTKSGLFCISCHVTWCSTCEKVLDAEDFSNKQLSQHDRNRRKCKSCKQKDQVKDRKFDYKKRKARKCQRRRYNAKKLFKNIYKNNGIEDTGYRSRSCRKCLKISAPSVELYQKKGVKKLQTCVIINGDIPVKRLLFGKGTEESDGKGSPLSQCFCLTTRRDLEYYVHDSENTPKADGLSLKKLAEIHEKWKVLTGYEDKEGNLVGDYSKLIHFLNQKSAPRLIAEYGIALRHIVIGLLGDLDRLDQEKFKLHDEILIQYRADVKENHKIYIILDKIEKLDQLISIEILCIKNTKNKKNIKSSEKKMKLLEKEKCLLQKSLKTLNGFYIQKRDLSYKNSTIEYSQGRQNSFTGNNAMKLLRKCPHLYLYKPHEFSIPGYDDKLTVGSEYYFSIITNLYKKLDNLVTLLWSTTPLCHHQIFHAQLRIDAWWKARSQVYPHKPQTWKEHILHSHALDSLKKCKSLARQCEELCEHNMQVVSKANKRSRNQHDPKKRIELKLKLCNINSRKTYQIIKGRRKSCKICGFFISRKYQPYCRCKTFH